MRRFAHQQEAAGCSDQRLMDALELSHQRSQLFFVADVFAQLFDRLNTRQPGEAMTQVGSWTHAAGGQCNRQGMTTTGHAAELARVNLLDQLFDALVLVKAHVKKCLIQQLGLRGMIGHQRFGRQHHNGLAVLFVMQIAADTGVAVQPTADSGLPDGNIPVTAFADAEFGVTAGVQRQHVKQFRLQSRHIHNHLLIHQAIGALCVPA